MMDMGYLLHLVNILTKLHKQQIAKVKLVGTLSEWLHVNRGVKQGCVLSPYLFNILAEMVMRDTLESSGQD
jgi:transcriptional regulatory protein LevR